MRKYHSKYSLIFITFIKSGLISPTLQPCHFDSTGSATIACLLFFCYLPWYLRHSCQKLSGQSWSQMLTLSISLPQGWHANSSSPSWLLFYHSCHPFSWCWSNGSARRLNYFSILWNSFSYSTMIYYFLCLALLNCL